MQRCPLGRAFIGKPVREGPWVYEPDNRCFDVEVVEWPVAAGGGRSSSSGRWDKRLFAEAKYAELVDDKI